MRKIYKTKKLLHTLVLAVCLGVSSMLSAQITGGTVTIDGANPTAGTNYNTWADFRTALNATTLTSALTVNVLSNRTESAQINFTQVTGASATNTITINGGGYFVEAAVADAVILMNGADFITFNNLKVRNTSSSQYVQGFRFTNLADNNKVDNCTIEFSNLTTGTTAGGAYVSFASSGTSLTSTTSTNNGLNNVISNNLMRTTNSNSPGPSYGIVVTGSNSSYTSTAQNNTFDKNTIQNFYYMGIYTYYTNGNEYTGNDISRANATSYNSSSTLIGIYQFYAYSSNRSNKVESNNIHDLPFVGATTSSAPSTVYAFYNYYVYGSNYSTNRSSISNNNVNKLRSTSSMYSAYNYFCYYMDFNGNMFDDNDIPSNSGVHYGINTSRTLGCNINNNTIKNYNGGSQFWGIRNYQQLNSSNMPTSISGNTIENNANVGNYFWAIAYEYVYNNNTSFLSINDNIIRDNVCNSYMQSISSYNIGIYQLCYGYMNIQRNKVLRNRATSGYYYGTYDYYSYDLNFTDNLYADNWGYYSTYPIFLQSYISGNYTANIRQNTIKLDGSLSGYGSQFCYGLYIYMYYHQRVNVEGNIVEGKNLYYFYPAYTYNTTPTNIKWDRNSYFLNNVSVQQWYCPSGTASSFTGWQSMGFAGSNEKYGDPMWNNAGASDYRSNTIINQNNIPFNSLDVRDANFVLRNTSQNDRGALEGFLDIQSTSTTFSPTPTVCAGTTFTPDVTVTNLNTYSIFDVDMGISVNGVLVGSKKITSTVASNATSTIAFNPYTFSNAGPVTVKIFVLNADDNPSNDTITRTFTVLKAPGGGILTQDVALSAPKAKFDITGKPDVTTYNQQIAYDLTAPSTVNYTNANFGSGWTYTITATTDKGYPVPSGWVTATPPSGGNNMKIKVNPASFQDSTLIIRIRINDLASGCDTTYIRKVLIAPQGRVKFKVPALICDKDEVYVENLSEVSSGYLLSQWDIPNAQPSSTDATSPVVVFNTYGFFPIKLTCTTVPHGYVTDTTIWVNVNEIPEAKFININACEGTAVRLINNTIIGSGSLSYEWSLGDNTTAVSTNVNKLYSQPGGYSVTLKATANGCSNSYTKNVYQFAKPVANFTKAAGNCENEEFEFENNSTISLGQFGSYWDFDDAGSKATLDEPTYDFVTPGTKNVKLKVVSEFGCTDSMVTPTVVKPSSVSDFTFPFACSRTATPFNNTSFIPAGTSVNSSTWDFGDNTSTTVTNPTKSWTSIGPKLVKLTTVLNNGCTDNITKEVNVGVQPTVAFNVPDQCAGSDVQFTNLTTFPQGDITYNWSFGDNNSSNIAQPRHTYTTGVGTQTFNVKLVASIAGGCKDSAVRTVTINPLPTTCNFDIARDFSVSKTGYTFTPQGTATGIDFTWLTGDGNSKSSSAAGTSYSYNGQGKYCVTMIARNASGCECSQTKCLTLTTDINSAEALNNALVLYPNPNAGVFNVSIASNTNSPLTVNVYNAIGVLVKTVVVDSNSAIVDLSDSASGVYTVKVSVNNQVVTKMVTVSK